MQGGHFFFFFLLSLEFLHGPVIVIYYCKWIGMNSLEREGTEASVQPVLRV